MLGSTVFSVSTSSSPATRFIVARVASSGGKRKPTTTSAFSVPMARPVPSVAAMLTTSPKPALFRLA
ncbi:hypothetical protein D3C75_1299270 [compost metagenome]